MDTPTKIKSIAQILRLKNTVSSSPFSREAVNDAVSMLKGNMSDDEAEKMRQKYRCMLTDEERAKDDHVIEKKVFHEGRFNQRVEYYFNLLGGRATAIDSALGEARHISRSFYISFDPSVKDINHAAYSDRATFLSRVEIPYDMSNKETKARLEAIAEKMYAQLSSGESLKAAAVVATMESLKGNVYPEEFDLLNEDVGEYFKSNGLRNVYKRENQRIVAYLDLNGRVEPREYALKDPESIRFMQLTDVNSEAERQIRAINVIRKIAKTEGWTPPRMLTVRKKELSALIERIEGERNELMQVLNKKKEEERKGREAEIKAEAERKEKEFIDSFLNKSTPIENTSIAYSDSEIGKKLSEFRATLSGHLTEDSIQKAGQMVYDAVSSQLNATFEEDEKRLADAREKFSQADKKRDTCRAAYKVAVRASKPLSELARLKDEWDKADKERAAFSSWNIRGEIERKNLKIMLDILSGIRPLCDKSAKELKSNLIKNTRCHDVPVVLDALQMYPKEFIDGLVKNNGKFTVNAKKNRGFWAWSGNEMCVRRGGKASLGCALHELGHGLERACPIIITLEKQFYDRRTKGCKLEKLRDLTGNSGYLDFEVARKDDFLDPYMGKDYEGNGYELVSMGFDWFFRHPDRMIKDPDYFKFIAGILTMVTP